MTDSPELPNDSELTSLLNELNGESKNSISPASETPNGLVLHNTPETPEIIEEAPVVNIPPSQSQTNGIDLGIVYDQSLNELITNYRQDRQDMEHFIGLLYDKLNANGPNRIFFESIAMTLRTKTEANNNLLKLIDNVGRRLDKQKGNDSLDLESLLDEQQE